MVKNFYTKHRALTLAEVLITLGIISVVAAITIPTLIAKYNEKQTVTKLKEVNSILAQALRSIQEEEGTPADWGLENIRHSVSDALIIANKLKPALKIALDCGFDDSKEICSPNTKYLTLNGYNDGNYSVNPQKYKLVLNNGTLLYIRSEDRDNLPICIYVDTNGKLPPNVFGRDMFQFLIDNNGGVHPGWIGMDTAEDCSLDSQGYTCARWILRNGNMDYLHKH